MTSPMSLDAKTRRARFEEIHAKRYFGITLDCGHKPTDPGNSIYDTGMPSIAGYATTSDGKRLCYSCTAEWIKQDMVKEGKAMLYLSGDGERVITWDGHPIAPTHVIRKTRGNFGDERWYFRFRFNGEVWTGMGQPGMYCRVKRTKYTSIFG